MLGKSIGFPVLDTTLCHHNDSYCFAHSAGAVQCFRCGFAFPGYSIMAAVEEIFPEGASMLRLVSYCHCRCFWWLYGNVALGLVMVGAMMLNLMVGAAVGMLAPMMLERMNRDPAIGSSVLLTFTTDSMGFFIFLGLATIFLV